MKTSSPATGEERSGLETGDCRKGVAILFATGTYRTGFTLAVLAMYVAAATAEQRTWTDNTGKFSVEAEFVAISDGKTVLKTAAGKTISVPLDRLSTADRRNAQSREHYKQLAAINSDPVASRIKASGAWVTVDRLRPGNPIVKVDFHSIYRQGADAALQHLEGLTSLEELDLSMDKITDTALVHLKGLVSLQKLDLSDTGITDAGLQHLQGLTSLQSLNLRNKGITDAGLVHLRKMTNLESLRLSGNQITDAGLVHLMGMTELRELGLYGGQITGTGLVNFRGMTKLRELGLNFTQVTDTGLAHLKGLTELRKLSLDRTQVTGAGLTHLKRLKNLEELNLGCPQVTSAGLEHLKGLTRLQSLTLSSTQIDDSGLKHLQGLTNLQNLGLHSPQITDSGLEHLAGLTKLETLWLDETQVSGAGLEHLQGMTNLRYLSLMSSRITDAGLKHLKGLPNLESLSLYGTTVTGAGLEHLKGLSNLTDIDLTGCRINDAGLKHLKGLTNLDSLDLSYTGIDRAVVRDLQIALPDTHISWSPTKQQRAAAQQAQLAAIAKLERLGAVVQKTPHGHPKSIRFRGEQMTDDGMEHLCDLPNLPSLDLTNAQITDAGLAHLWGLKKLSILDLSGCQITDAGLTHLKGLKNLDHLSLNRTQVTGSGLDHLRELGYLRFLELNGARVTDAGLKGLENLKTLGHLELSSTQVTDAGMEHLNRLPKLMVLYLLNTAVTDDGVAAHRKVRNLNLWLITKPTSEDDMAWLKQLAKIRFSPIVVFHGPAEKKFVHSLLLRAHSLEPDNSQWAAKLAEWYSTEAMQLKRNDPDNTESYVENARTALEYFDEAIEGIEDDEKEIYTLKKMAKLSFDAGEFKRAETYAKRLLDLSTSGTTRGAAGVAVHHGNLILGRLALRAGDVDEAKSRLIVAGESGGWTPFGPNMALAKDLLEKGEREIVLEYFNLCSKSWRGHEHPIEQWTKEIQKGNVPDFGAYLVY